MDDRIMQFRVGVMVLATGIIAAILLVVFGEVPKFGLGRKTFLLEMNFPSAPGVTKETPVRKSGILIGRVTAVRFAEDSSVIVTAAIYEDVKLRKGERCQIKGGLLGDATLEFVPGKIMKPIAYYQDGDRIERGLVVGDPMEVLASFREDIAGAINTFNTTGHDIGVLAKRLNKLVDNNDEQIERIMNETEAALKSLNLAMQKIDQIVGDDEVVALQESISTLPKLVEQTQQTFAQMQHTIQLADANLENLTKFTDPLGENGERIVLKVADSVTNLNALLEQMVTLSESLNSNKGSLGQLIHNPDLYQSLVRAARNIEHASKQLMPIVRDARVFTDKVSRHPGIILRDAVRPGAGIK